MNTVNLKYVERPWGGFQLIYASPSYWTKLITVNPGESLSLQLHEERTEFWAPIDHGLRGVINGAIVDLEVGVRYDVMKNVIHRVSNPTEWHASFIEVATGSPREEDIVRIQDKYGR